MSEQMKNGLSGKQMKFVQKKQTHVKGKLHYNKTASLHLNKVSIFNLISKCKYISLFI